MKHLAIVRITLELLRLSLGLPKTISILACMESDPFYAEKIFNFMLEGEGLPAVVEGSQIPVVCLENVR